MSLPMTTRSGTLPVQALISGRVEDSLTSGAPRGALTVRLLDRDTGAEYPLAGRVLANGTFAFYGLPETAFPRLSVQTYHLRVEASAANYQADGVDLDLGPAAGQPALVTRPIPTPGIDDAQVQLFTGGGLPRTDLALSLDRNAVRLKGQVLVSDDPTTGVANAQLTQNPPGGPSTTADADGNFEFPSPLPVVPSLTIQITAAGFEPSTITYEPDYTQPLNELTIPLKRS
jgi:hypothetical protein